MRIIQLIIGLIYDIMEREMPVAELNLESRITEIVNGLIQAAVDSAKIQLDDGREGYDY